MTKDRVDVGENRELIEGFCGPSDNSAQISDFEIDQHQVFWIWLLESSIISEFCF